MPSKLHLNISNKPACGRQLNNHREARAQLQDRALLVDFEGFKVALGNSLLNLPGYKACRHCAKATGLLPRVSKRQTDELAEEMIEKLVPGLAMDEEEENAE